MYKIVTIGKMIVRKGEINMKNKWFYASLTAAIAMPTMIVPVHAATVFTDIEANSPYMEATMLLREKGVITGYPDGTYRPAASISRQHVLKLIDQMVELKSVRQAVTFHDVPVTHPYYEVIQKAYQAGIIDGDRGYFYPEKSLTRAQAAKILTHAFQLDQTAEVPFLDVSAEHWAFPFIQALASNQLTTTAGDYFKPSEAVTRGQFALFLHRLLVEEEAPDMTGEWSGILQLPQGSLEIRFAVAEDGTGTVSVPAQGLLHYPATISIEQSSIDVVIHVAGTTMEISGDYQNGQINATFSQSGMTFPMTFTPFEAAPVSYEKISVPVAGGELTAALQWPEQKENIPVAIIIAGSGPTTKDGNSAAGENNSLKMIAEDLAAQGIATIRYDKRGVGENMPLLQAEEEASIALYAEDVEQIINYVKADERFTTVHIIGHSEGSLVGMVAAGNKAVDSIISIAGAGRTIDEVLMEQLAAQLPAHLLQQSESIVAQLKAGTPVADVPAELYLLFRPSVQPYLMSWLQYDPAQLLSALNTRSLIVQGKNDLQVKVVDAEQLRQATPSAQIAYFDNMNHVLKDAPTDLAGNYATYANPTLPLAEGLIETIADFIHE